MTPLDFASRMMAYCSKHRGSVTSWGRSPERNESVGGHSQSKHMVWLGMDVGYSPNPTPNFTDAQSTARQLDLLIVREDDHDHFQPTNR